MKQTSQLKTKVERTEETGVVPGLSSWSCDISPRTEHELHLPANTEDVLEPLFDYSKTLPPFDDSKDDDEVELRCFVPKLGSNRDGLTPGNPPTSVVGYQKFVSVPSSDVASSTAKNDDDWLADPPPLPGRQEALDPTLTNIKRQKQELHEILLSSAKSLSASEARVESAKDESAEAEQPPSKRQKILLRLQADKGEPQGFRIFTDDPLEKLFAHYARSVQNSPNTDFTFCFDGMRLDPKSKPVDVGMDDEDIVEVFKKGSK